MRRFFWKEWRERGALLLLMLLAVVLLAALGKGQPVFGADDWPSLWVMLPFILACLIGLTAYGSEMRGERAAFLYSRAVCGEQLLLAKVLPGLAVAALAPFLGALAYRIVAPDVYLPFLTPANLLLGAASVMPFFAAPYLVGLGCSIALSELRLNMEQGTVRGSWMALVLLFVLMLGHYFAFNILGVDIWYRMEIPLFLVPIGFASLGARLGYTPNAWARLGRVTLLAAAPLIAIFLLETALAKTTVSPTAEETSEYDRVLVSPTGEFALASQRIADVEERRYRYYWLDLSSDRTTALHMENDYPQHWLSGKCLRMHGDEPRRTTILWWDPAEQRPEKVSIVDKEMAFAQFIVSPDERRVLMASSRSVWVLTLSSGETRAVAVLEREQLNRLVKEHPEKCISFRRCWWESADMIGYIDPLTEETVLAPAP